MAGRRGSAPDVGRAQRLRAVDENRYLSQDSSQDAAACAYTPGIVPDDLVLPGPLLRQETPEYWPEIATPEQWADMMNPMPRSAAPRSHNTQSFGTGDHTLEPWPQPEYKPSCGFATEHEFCIKLSMANIEGRPLSVTLARVGQPDTPIIGCSPGFLALCGLPRQDVIGQNARFLNQRSSMTAESRHRLQYSVKTGSPFMGLINNRRHAGGGVYEDFENLMHLVVIAAGNRKYFLGIQANVTGLNLNLDIGGVDARRLQTMFDSVLSAQVDSWIHMQEGALHTLPLYLYIRLSDTNDDENQVELVEGALCGAGPALAAPDQYLVLAPQFSPEGPTDVPLMWQTIVLGSVPGSPAVKDDEMSQVRQLGPPTVGQKHSSQNHARPPAGYAAGAVGVAEKANQEGEASKDDIDPSGWKDQLRTLSQENPAAILIARGITKLGLESGERLRQHFRLICDLKYIQVPCQYKKRRGLAKASKPQEPRIAGRCFMVMKSPEEATRMLTEGPEYLVDGVDVTLAPFEPHDCQE